MSGPAQPYLVPPCTAAVEVLYQDPWLLVARKPTGLLSVPGRDPRNRDSVQTRLRADYPELRIVHRLDMDTSGLMLLARDAIAQAALNRQFAERKVSKAYIALVAGVMPAVAGEIDLPLICDWPNRPRQKVCHLHGKPALTRWSLLEGDRQRGHSRLRLTPVTGRSHQLRLHLAAIGHPILGCAFYADAPSRASAPRLCLHAQRLGFVHPGRGQWIEFVDPAPF